jgi:hypothetical protein
VLFNGTGGVCRASRKKSTSAIGHEVSADDITLFIGEVL